mgnify:CR=1 FL=1
MTLAWLWTGIAFVYQLLIVWFVLTLLRRPREPKGMLAWILALILLPVLGPLLFIVFGEPRKRRHRRRRKKRLRRLREQLTPADKSLARTPAPDVETLRMELQTLSRLGQRLGAYSAVGGNDAKVYQDAEQTFLALQLAMEAAESHIHMEYYIWQPDDTGQAVRDLLIAKAKQGVACRVLLDYIGCFHMSRSFIQPMRDAGVEVAFAMPYVPLRGISRMNFRNHRKIVVIDGKVGFTGSQNIGDEYAGRPTALGKWRDTHMKLAGPVVRQLQDVFVSDWHYTTKQQLSGVACFPPIDEQGEHIVQVVPSGPDQREPVMHQLLFAAVSAARRSVCVITPYFVPDQAMLMALQSASYRGARVRLIVPSCSDHRLVLWAGRSYYEDLSLAGIEIYEHDSVMLHSKVLIIDREWALVGSANMDQRSFLINYELTSVLYSKSLAGELYQDFEQVRSQCRQVTAREIHNRSFLESVLLGTARLTSPIL